MAGQNHPTQSLYHNKVLNISCNLLNTGSEKQNGCLGPEWLLRIPAVHPRDCRADWEHTLKQYRKAENDGGTRKDCLPAVNVGTHSESQSAHKDCFKGKMFTIQQMQKAAFLEFPLSD